MKYCEETKIKYAFRGVRMQLSYHGMFYISRVKWEKANKMFLLLIKQIQVSHRVEKERKTVY